MKKAKARRLFEDACHVVGEDVPPPKDWQRVDEKTFLAVYCGWSSRPASGPVPWTTNSRR